MIKKIIKLNDNLVDQDYIEIFKNIKQQVAQAQVKAILSVNRELIKLYWEVGKIIHKQQAMNGWGSKTIEILAQDLAKEFPGLAGFSRANIFRMQAFYEAYEIVAQPARQLEDLPVFNIPWFQNIVIVQKIKNAEERLWYVQKSIEFGWSRTILEMQIDSQLFHRQGKAITNFAAILPSPDSDMAQQAFKDPYMFDFLTLTKQHKEHDLEKGLVNNVQDLLLEMGKGFALYARQYHLEVGGDDFYIDLLFYHTKLKCYVVVELKARDFDPKDVGQINFYLSAVDDLVADKDDNPTIGLILCKSKNNFTAEYALRGMNKPIGVAQYATDMLKKLEKEFEKNLPSVEELESQFAKREAMQDKETHIQESKPQTKKPSTK